MNGYVVIVIVLLIAVGALGDKVHRQGQHIKSLRSDVEMYRRAHTEPIKDVVWHSVHYNGR